MRELGRLRLRLTFWYAGIFMVILGLLGAGLFAVIRHQIARQLDTSLQAATAALMQAARIREVERAHAKGAVVDAVDELHIPDRSLYLLDSLARPIKPEQVAPWIQAAAREAAAIGRADRDRSASGEHALRLHAERFRGTAGTAYVAVAVADPVELEDQYPSLIAAFRAAALARLLLVAGGGPLLVGPTPPPAEPSTGPRPPLTAPAAHAVPTPLP